jgi:hypothetical protein
VGIYERIAAHRQTTAYPFPICHKASPQRGAFVCVISIYGAKIPAVSRDGGPSLMIIKSFLSCLQYRQTKIQASVNSAHFASIILRQI